ncbi:Protein CBG28015 [Caenorhabditis briggsae]|uniref:Protein CBG24109 n=1 Tax=Caenorhabditis briggsae TaxID=6238 RepID=G2J6H5_CAEBR|nr:Protein CBG24109 [Caenorhabditis briggsae]XP_045098410.1 Protein CBG28015 [Caenorhabditis briggsae]CAP20796.1 Protein CBG24109 [Caenorhabditis briggsae]CAR98841.1 Protein CBG28015 [Caenorhabditis briggsae]
MHSILEIYDPKKRNDIVQSYLKNRKEHKVKNLQERSDLEHIEDHRIDVFKPILESNKKLQEEIIDEKNKIVETLNNFKPLSQHSIGTPTIKQKSLIKQPSVHLPKEILPSSSSPLVVSSLIVSYLQDNSDRSNAGYSVKFDKDEKKYTIGNKDITFTQNMIKINNDEYTATEGLMELLTKKSPNLKKIDAEDTKNYQTILLCSNGLYQGFDKSSKRYNSDSSDKWAFIKANYFVAKTSTTTSGSSISFIPSNTNSLIDSLRLSIASFQAGNNGEYNKINAILDELVKQKKIKKKDLGVIYLNIGL